MAERSEGGELGGRGIRTKRFFDDGFEYVLVQLMSVY